MCLGILYSIVLELGLRRIIRSRWQIIMQIVVLKILKPELVRRCRISASENKNC